MSSNRATASTATSESIHAEILTALIRGAPGSTTEALQDLYEAIAPVAYRGTTETPVERRWRREVLASLQEDRTAVCYDTPRGVVWIPLEGGSDR